MNSLGNKKILIILAIIIVLLAIPTIFVISESSHTTQPAQNNSATTENANSNAIPTNSLATYQNDFYTLSYPNAWTKKEAELTNDGGNLVTFQPQQVTSAQYATISVEVLDSQITSMSTIIRIFNILHYSETNSTADGISALKYTAVIPSQKGNLHSTAYIFQRNGKIYTVKLEYIQTDTNEQLEGQFYQLLSSFSTR